MRILSEAKLRKRFSRQPQAICLGRSLIRFLSKISPLRNTHLARSLSPRPGIAISQALRRENKLPRPGSPESQESIITLGFLFEIPHHILTLELVNFNI